MAALDEDPVKKSLLRAIIKGNANKVAEILKNNAKLSADESLDSAQNRLLHKAARYGKNKVVKTLIEVCGANPNAKNKFDMTPLHHAAVEGEFQVLKPFKIEIARLKIINSSFVCKGSIILKKM